jgi:beta-galactosidase
VTGPGAIAAVDNGDISSHEPFQTSQRSAYQGRCVCILRANSDAGQIKLEASASGLASGVVTIAAAPGK